MAAAGQAGAGGPTPCRKLQALLPAAGPHMGAWLQSHLGSLALVLLWFDFAGKEGGRMSALRHMVTTPVLTFGKLTACERQMKIVSEFVARVDAIQEYLASRDPKFWDEWPAYLAAAKRKVDNPFEWWKPSTGEKAQ